MRLSTLSLLVTNYSGLEFIRGKGSQNSRLNDIVPQIFRVQYNNSPPTGSLS